MVIKVTRSTSKERFSDTDDHDQPSFLRRKSTMTNGEKRPGSPLEGRTSKSFIVGSVNRGAPSPRVAHPQKLAGVAGTSDSHRGAMSFGEDRGMSQTVQLISTILTVLSSSSTTPCFLRDIKAHCSPTYLGPRIVYQGWLFSCADPHQPTHRSRLPRLQRTHSPPFYYFVSDPEGELDTGRCPDNQWIQ